jgi:hypothetical protein
MKKLFLPLLPILFTTALLAQTNAADQNPNYLISQTKYMAAKDSLLRGQSTTVQATYTAYDWMAIRQERKDIRFLNRQQRRLNRSQYGYYPDAYYNQSYYGNGYYNNGYYRNRYGSGNYYYNRYRPSFLWWFLL